MKWLQVAAEGTGHAGVEYYNIDSLAFVRIEYLSW